jgi:hypothetical protein
MEGFVGGAVEDAEEIRRNYEYVCIAPSDFPTPSSSRGESVEPTPIGAKKKKKNPGFMYLGNYEGSESESEII